MQQVLFNIPILKDSFPPDGFPVPGFGAMLFATFIMVVVWGTPRARKIGMPPERFQDFVIWVFVSGLVGARILYMIQYANHYPDHSVLGLLGAFVRIWEGGIVFYGSAFGGAVGYGLFYWLVMRKMNVSGWQLADAVAPLLALGLAVGRIGCYLNGCCWGQVACEVTCPVPLGAAHFPLLTAHSRGQLVGEQYLQTSTGFAVAQRDRANPFEDPRSLVTAVEKGSAADKADVRPGDRIVMVNGKPNAIVVDVSGADDKVNAAVEKLKAAGARDVAGPPGRTRVEFDELEHYFQGRRAALAAAPGVDLSARDTLEVIASDWPRGRSRLTLSVEREGQLIPPKTFVPATVGLYPTQLYETLSMVLLIVLLLAYYPHRRHDGQLMVLLMIGYAAHRFINESLRIEPSYGLGLTLSQWGSVVILVVAIGMEIYLWRTMPSRWKVQPPPTPTAPSPLPTATAP